MLLSDEEIKERLESPINLMNRLRSLNTQHTPVVSLPPTADQIIPDIDAKLNDTRAKAHAIMNATMDQLKSKILEIEKPEKLAIIAREMSQIIQQQDQKSNGNVVAGQIVVYAPTLAKIEQFEVVDVQEDSQ